MAVTRRILLLAVLALLPATIPGGSGAARPRPGEVRTSSPPAPPPAVASFRSVRTYHEVAVPVRIRIPALHLDTPLKRLGRDADGAIAVPASPSDAGWYEEGPRPGQPGPAVILGHVDSVDGPGVFFHLYELSPGAVVYVDRADGSIISFRVGTVARVPKTKFPTDQVYSPTLEPALQLVTCGGDFNPHARSYLDNVIVYTVPA
jgi:sortase (surface protein transpeptidase)